MKNSLEGAATDLRRRVVITGGAGFVGSNLAERLLSYPDIQVTILDDLSRSGVCHNLTWLQELPTRDRLTFIHGDIRDFSVVRHAIRDATEIYHLAAQVAVTSSVAQPRNDFEVNLLGTLNVLEAVRQSGERPFLLFTSTNKVYGALESLPLTATRSSMRVLDPDFIGLSEMEPLDFHSPYGCSKGSADQYVRDYARIYDLPTVVFRMSCIAGPRQFGTEDQGWVAHFLYSVLEDRPFTVYGDGLQVRDVLHVYDLIDAMESAFANLNRTAGEVYNIGGGLERSISVIDMIENIEQMTGRKALLNIRAMRQGDQMLYISDTQKLSRHTGWAPRRSQDEILNSIYGFWMAHQTLLTEQRRNVHPQDQSGNAQTPFRAPALMS